MASKGSFGLLLAPRYQITDAGVTLRRNGMAILLMLGCLAGGAVLLAIASPNINKHMNAMLAGGALGGLGVFLLFVLPLGMPGQIVCTRDGVEWGGQRFASGDVREVKIVRHAVRGNRGGQYYQWLISLTPKAGKGKTQHLAQHGTDSLPLVTKELNQAFAALYPPAAPPAR